MVNKVVNATYTETYDLKTTTGKMAVLGIHTPTAPSLKKMFRGFFEQYKKVKINACNIVGVCASNQSLTPAEVGLTAGLTSPRDVLNPILFKAATGENLNLLLDKIYGSAGTDDGSIHTAELQGGASLQAYYTMLADDSFRKFHPQGGVRISSLRPMVHKVATTQPFKWSVGPLGTNDREFPQINAGSTPDTTGSNRGFGGSNGTNVGAPSVFISNGMEPMPWMETTYEDYRDDITDPDSPSPKVMTVLAASIPKIYCGCLVLPPSELVELYFRFSISWSVSFKDFRPAYEIGSIDDCVTPEPSGMGNTALYYNLYNTSKMLTDEYGSFDCDNVDTAEEVMTRAD